MNEDTISDSRLAGMLRRYISSNPRYDSNKKLNNIKLCGSRVMPAPSGDSRVYVVVAEDKARFMGIATCHSPWSCPVCTAKAMAKKGAEIAALIEAKAKLYNEAAFMLTFTLPHTDDMTCYQSYTVLEKTWRMFTKTAGAGRKTKSGRPVELGAYNTFRHKFNIHSMVRVYEFTWGHNGWHPHIHALLWTNEKNFPDLLEWEDKLTERWFHCARYCHQKLLKETDPKLMHPVDLDDLYSTKNLFPKTGHRSVFFSKTNDGKVRKEVSSRYISGWGANMELTSQQKKFTKQSGHYTIQQILEKADKATDYHVRNFWLDLFLEYAVTTQGHKRVNFTPADRHLIKKWVKTEGFVMSLKKRITDKVQETRPVFWFSKQQWHDILISEYATREDIRYKILLQALRDPSKIPKLLAKYDIDVTKNDLNDSGMRHLRDTVLASFQKEFAA